MKEFACGDVVPGCDARMSGDTEEAVLAQVAAHAAEAHGMTSIPAELVEQVRQKIHAA